MKVRAALVVVVLGALAVGAVGVSPGVSASGGTATGSRVETVTGVLERMVVETVDGEQIRYAVRGADRTWWLEGLADPAPAPGSEVEVTGTPRDEYTLTVATIRVTAGEASALATAAAVRGTARMLVLRAFWSARPPARPTKATTRQRVVDASGRWYREVSHGRYRVSGTVTPWLRVARPGDCYKGSFRAMDQALSAARRRGFRLERFQRFILYMPCSAGGMLGYGSFPGQHIVVFNTLDLNVMTHEQGHNIGLPHASSRECKSSTGAAMTWSSKCITSEYGDEIDSMGNRRAGHYNAFYKWRLGWLQRLVTVTSSRTVRLTPFETTGRGVKGIRLRAGGATYWIEHRTRIGADRKMLPGTAGVQVRYQAGDQTQLLDAGPGSTTGYYDFADGHLPAGSSWTTPQNVRVTVVNASASGATLAFKFRAGAPKPPSSPGPVRVQALVHAARITWTQPADNGAIIRRYVITRSDGAKQTVSGFPDLATTYTWRNLVSTRAYTFSVQAVNQAGASAAARSPLVRALTDKPSVVITSPANGATVSGDGTVSVTVTPNPRTKSPIDVVELVVDDIVHLASADAAPWQLIWPTTWFADGRHTIRVEVHDRAGKTGTATRTVMIDNVP